eukprot:10797094-Alexandrium_andersonii.AAC.1
MQEASSQCTGADNPETACTMCKSLPHLKKPWPCIVMIGVGCVALIGSGNRNPLTGAMADG